MIRIQTKDTICSIHCWVRLRWWWPWVWSCHQPAGTRLHNIRWADPIEQPQHKIWAETPTAIEQGKRVDSPSSVNPSHFQMYGIDGRFLKDFPHTWTLSSVSWTAVPSLPGQQKFIHLRFSTFSKDPVKKTDQFYSDTMPAKQSKASNRTVSYFWRPQLVEFTQREQRRLVTPGHCMPFNWLGHQKLARIHTIGPCDLLLMGFFPNMTMKFHRICRKETTNGTGIFIFRQGDLNINWSASHPSARWQMVAVP